MAWLLLATTVVLEVVATTLLKVSGGPSDRPIYFAGAMLSYGVCFWALSLAFKSIPFTIAYAIWAGVGTALTAIAGIFLFGETMTVVKTVSIALIVIGVAGLNLASRSVGA